MNFELLPMRQFVTAFILVGVVYFGFITKSLSQTLPESKHTLVVIAHRGNHVNVPENTLASYKLAIVAGADYVEVDLRTTKDGHLIVLHDSKVDRITNGQGKISEMTLEEVKKLKVFNQNWKTHKIPEFREVLQTCKGKINIYLDFKEADVAQTWKQIEAAGMQHHVVVYLNKKEQYAEWKKIAPHVPLMTSLPEEMNNEEGLELFLKEMKISVLDNLSDPKLVKLANQLGVSVWLDVQDPKEGAVSWNAALKKGVNGLQTDKPAELVEYLK
ncbi:glycerophosphodiester phosphodiesterase family protein [Dyadobacter sp. NIV53]|uniref:glycerophosphodiester phosphodiesterase family protein n=1 Tax=Dyadobacter sp. NIV53 TaxID=2861765 RepID=UPI001E308866|nr:glycerophosphodiester phosphodiesterase family protein [Dyadobacter sp. NIV53]